MPKLTGLKKLYIQNTPPCEAKVSVEVQAELQAALAARGGQLEYYEQFEEVD